MSNYCKTMIELGYDGEYRPLVPESRANAGNATSPVRVTSDDDGNMQH